VLVSGVEADHAGGAGDAHALAILIAESHPTRVRAVAVFLRTTVNEPEVLDRRAVAPHQRGREAVSIVFVWAATKVFHLGKSLAEPKVGAEARLGWS
jgi:hypothetical protein